MTRTPRPEHIIALVEANDDHSPTIEVARRVVERGGDATVVVLVTKQAREAIDVFARDAHIPRGDAEEFALDIFAHQCEVQVGQGTASAIAHDRADRLDIVRFIQPGTSAIAVPDHLLRSRSIRRLADTTGLPVVVTPRRAA